METKITREQAYALLTKYNQEPFHIQHALTVEGVMRYFARKLGYGAEEDFWGLVGLLHDVDFEKYPEQHCVKAPELLREIGAEDGFIHAVVCHGYGLCVDVKPELEMEKVLFATDELTGLIGADAPQPQRGGYGAFQPEEEIQGQEIRRRMLTRRDPSGRGKAGLGAGQAAGRHYRSRAA